MALTHGAETSVASAVRMAATSSTDVMKLFSALLVAAVLALLQCAANAATVGDWFTGSTDDGQLYAAVTNESGGFLTKSCHPGSGLCRWILVTATPCSGSTTAPALLSSSRGSATVDLSCDGPVRSTQPTGMPMYRYLLHDPDLMDGIVESSTPWGSQ